MNSLKNTVRLIGRVGRPPQIKQLSNNNKRARLSLITKESYKNAAGEKVVDTELHYLVATGRNADLIEKSISEGSEIAIEGKLCTRTFVNSANVKNHTAEIQVREILILDRRDPVVNAAHSATEQKETGHES